MALIDDCLNILNRLSGKGWSELFLEHGLDINTGDLRNELLRPLANINRELEGFEDFSPDGVRAIEPGKPGLSLLYHAFASPNVQLDTSGQLLGEFPSLADIDVIENLVFGIEAPSLHDLEDKFSEQPLSVVVFACDYRPALHTSHRRYADLTFSRTGISRVGTASENYVGRVRGFMPFVAGEHKGIRVLPCRYSAYLAVKQFGNEEASLPMRFRMQGQEEIGDDLREFWQPIHKLFGGNECLNDVPNLEVNFSSAHINEKLRRIHLELNQKGVDTNVSPTDLEGTPYRLREGLAELTTSIEYPSGTLIPVPHKSLIEAAMHDNKRAVFPVPAGARTLSSSFFLTRNKSAPEFVHARHQVLDDGSVINLNNSTNVQDVVSAGGFNAQHYLDFSADGVVSVDVGTFENNVASIEPAYSLVCAPDFYPQVDQRELTDWTENLNGPVSDPRQIWGVPPVPLCDVRLPPNLQFPDHSFLKEDTITAVVNLPAETSQTITMKSMDPMRHSGLPDDAAGFFDPGWDVSMTTDQSGTNHLANHGLGSPFPEDAKLCAAIAAFWPAVAPDIARSVQPIRPGNRMRTVAPLTDQEIGLDGGVPWDGIEPLRVIDDFGGKFIEYAAFDQTDYVEQALDNNLTVALVGKLSAKEYQHRVLCMAMFYQALRHGEIRGHGENSSLIFSFRNVSPSDRGLLHAQQMTNTDMGDTVYRLRATSLDGQSFFPTGDRRARIRVNRPIRAFVAPALPLGQSSHGILFSNDNDQWRFLSV